MLDTVPGNNLAQAAKFMQSATQEKKLDPRIVRTRRDIVGSMFTLLREKTFGQITVQQITEGALINRGTFYDHFEDKFDLLEYMVTTSFQKLLDVRMASCEGFSEENLQMVTLATCEFLAGFYDRYGPCHNKDHPPIERQLQPYLYQLLLKWLGADGGEHSAETIAMTTSWAIFGTALQWSLGGREISAEMLTDQIMTLLTPGLSATFTLPLNARSPA